MLTIAIAVVACTGHGSPEPSEVEVPAPESLPVIEPAKREPAPVVEVAPPRVPTTRRIELSRGGCYGTCPIYRVVLTADGDVQWRGDQFVEVRGEARRTISRAAFDALWTALVDAPFAKLPRDYLEHTSPACPSYRTDHDTATVVLSGDGVDERVADYLGCVGNDDLDAFRELEARIDTVARTSKWIGKCATGRCKR